VPLGSLPTDAPIGR